MKICLINPNSTRSMNEGILQTARMISEDISPKMTFEVTEVTESPALINSDIDEVVASYWTLQKAITLKDRFDGFVIACHSDPGVSAIREATGKPVVGIGFASLKRAEEYGRPFAILVVSEKSIPRKTMLAQRYGLSTNFDSLATGYCESMDKQETLACLKSAALMGLKNKSYRSFALGCAGMSCVADELQKELGIPVVDGVAEAIRILSKEI